MKKSCATIDEIDNEIIHILIEDARISLKEISKKCGISSVSVLNRINRLKKNGVITGATLFTTLKPLGFQIVATIGVETDLDTQEIVKFLKENAYLIEPSMSVGEFDFSALVYAESMESLNARVETIKRRYGIRKVTVNVWSGLPELNFRNLDLCPKEAGKNGQT